MNDEALSKMFGNLRTIVICISFVCATFSFLLVFTEEVSAQTLTVDNTGGGQFTTIRAALNAAASGDTILVAYGTGTYNENTNANPLYFNFPLYIIGSTNQQGQCPVVIGSNPANHVFELGPLAYPAQIENFGIRGASVTGCSGVYSQSRATYANSVCLQNLRVTGNSDGIHLTSSSSYHLLDGCHIYQNDRFGIYLDGSDHIVDDCGSGFSINTGIFGNGQSGIYSSSLSRATISDTNIYDNDGAGIYIISGSSITIDNVEVWENGWYGIYLSGYDNFIDGYHSRSIKDNHASFTYSGSTTASHVWLSGSCTLQRYKIWQTDVISDGEVGITCGTGTSTTYVTVTNCEVCYFEGECSKGVELGGYNRLTGADTEIHDCTDGVLASGNSMIDCQENGQNNIYLISEHGGYWGAGVNITGDYVTVRDTIFQYCDVGISTNPGVYVDHLDVDGCYFDQTDTGIILEDTSSSTIDGCDFEGNADGCILLKSSTRIGISGSSFANGAFGVYLASDSSSNAIDDCDFVNYYQVGYVTAVYIDGGSSNTVSNSDFDNCVYGIKIVGNGTNGGGNAVESSVFTDTGDLLEYPIGIFCQTITTADLLKNDFYDLHNAIQLIGAKAVNIYGNSSSYSIIHDCDYVLNATPYNDNTGCEEGEMTDYDMDMVSLGDAMIVYLEGASSSSETDFTYDDITGQLGADYSVTEGDFSSWSSA